MDVDVSWFPFLARLYYDVLRYCIYLNALFLVLSLVLSGALWCSLQSILFVYYCCCCYYCYYCYCLVRYPDPIFRTACRLSVTNTLSGMSVDVCGWEWGWLEVKITQTQPRLTRSGSAAFFSVLSMSSVQSRYVYGVDNRY